MWNTSILFFSSSNYSNFVKVIADHIGGTLKLWDSCLKLGQGWWKMEHCAPDHINGQWAGYFLRFQNLMEVRPSEKVNNSKVDSSPAASLLRNEPNAFSLHDPTPYFGDFSSWNCRSGWMGSLDAMCSQPQSSWNIKSAHANLTQWLFFYKHFSLLRNISSWKWLLSETFVSLKKKTWKYGDNYREWSCTIKAFRHHQENAMIWDCIIWRVKRNPSIGVVREGSRSCRGSKGRLRGDNNNRNSFLSKFTTPLRWSSSWPWCNQLSKK